MSNEQLKRQLASWRDKLLDLNKRNKLIHTKVSAKSLTMLPIVDELPWQVHEHLIGRNKSFGFLPNEELDPDLETLVPIKHKVPRFEPGVEIPQLDNYEDDDLQTNLPENRLQTVLSNIQRRSKSSIEEQGFNTLYITLGLLEWFEAPGIKDSLKSPLVLMPVKLDREEFGREYRLKHTGDDLVFNPALVQKLILQGFGDLSEIQNSIEVEDDLSIQNIFEQVYEKLNISEQQGWSIRNQVFLGLFSFTKLSLYNDLKKSENLFLQSDLIQRLCGVRQSESDFQDFQQICNTALDEIDSLAFYPIMDADSSQLRAVLAAKKGLSYVLQGPPGTGKSQTIANIISEAVANQKTVLFVSEKMAALNVVKDRLASKGLGQYALELHSHKAQKKMVIQELDRCLSFREPIQPHDTTVFTHIDGIRQNLNQYGEAILKPRGGLNKTFYDVVSLFESLSAVGDIRHAFSDPLALTDEDIKKKEELLTRFEHFFEKFGDASEHALFGLKPSGWDLMLDQSYEVQLNEILDEAKKLSTVKSSLKDLGFKIDAFDQFERLKSCKELISDHKGISKSWYESPDHSSLKQQLNDLTELQKPILEKREELLEFADLDKLEPSQAKELIDSLRPYLSGFKASLVKVPLVNLFFGQYRKAANTIAGFWQRASWESPQVFDLLQDYLKWHEKYLKLKAELEENDKLFTIQPDALSDELRKLTSTITLYEDDKVKLDEFIQAEEIDSIFLDRQKYLDAIENALSVFSAYQKKCEEFFGSFNVASESALARSFFETELDGLSQSIDGLLQAKPKLREWIEYTNCIADLEAANLLGFTQSAPSDLAKGELAKALRKAFYLNWISTVQRQEPAIGEFSLDRMNQYINGFRQADLQLIEAGNVRIREVLEENLPQGALQYGEPGILKKEAKKKRKIMPIRRLFSKIPNLVKSIKPVFLMSPLSVAMYLEPGQVDFDMVIFDEASQIFPEDAIGALIRAKQVIVVGDSKQMPPTNFFNSSKFGEESDSSEEEEEFEVVEMESILDFAETSLNSLTLNWHYRSKHEYLITFSNHNFYENRLITFPGTTYQKSLYGLHFNHISNGVYDAGKSRTNLAEAEAIVSSVVNFVREFPGLSLGVIAMSQAQQDCIINLLENTAVQTRNTQLMEVMSRIEEPLFVKNLENVQGDERDVILLSVGYAKDQAGTLRKNFGPLNREGGERRLNVAVSRARKRLEVFCSFLPEDLDLSSSKSKGAHLLKDFLSFARNPELGVRERAVSQGGVESPFEENVKAALEQRGLNIATQVGCSGFRIDLAVVHPNHPGQFILGVECDGAAYHSTQAARDRDRLRQAVLENMGWEIYRIWSTDWLARKEEILDEICSLVSQLAQQSSTAFECFEPVTQPLAIDEPEIVEEYQPPADEGPMDLGIFEEYQFASSIDLDLEIFDFQKAEVEEIQKCLLHVLEVQAPITEDDLYRTVAGYYGMAKVGSRIRDRLDHAASRIPESQYRYTGTYFYPTRGHGYAPRLWIGKDKPRPIESFVPEELEAVILRVLELTHRISEEELIKCASQSLTYKKQGNKILTRFQDIIKGLLKARKIKENDGLLELG